MARVKRAQIRKTRKKNLAQASKGFFGGRRRYRQSREAVMKAQTYAFAGRKQKKRAFRALWIQRIGAALLPHGISYSRFIHGLGLAGIDLNRKVLADLACNDPAGFEAVVVRVREALG